MPTPVNDPLRRLSELQRIAITESTALARSGVRAIAVTGSVARGRIGPSSDVDIWVLGGPRDERLTYRRRTAWVTHLWQPVRIATSFDNLCSWDVDELWVTYDPYGLFAQLRSRYAAQRPAIRQAIIDGTFNAISFAAQRARSGSRWEQLLLLRDLAWRLPSLAIYLERGLRVAKLRHIRQWFDARTYRTALDALGLDHAERTRQTTVSSWRGAAAVLARWYRRPELAPACVQRPSTVAEADTADTVLNLQRLLTLQAIPAAVARFKVNDVVQLREAAPAIFAAIAAVNGLPSLDEVPAPVLRRTRAATGRLLAALPLGEVLPRALRQLVVTAVRD